MHGIQRQGDEAARDATMAERLSGRLRRSRHLHGLTLKALADAARCSESLLSKIENGKACPSLPTLDRLSRALQTDIGWLLAERDAAEPGGPPAGATPAAPASGPAIAMGPAGTASRSDHVLRCRMLHLDVGATSPDERNRAGEEAGYLVGGELELVLGGQVRPLKAGDTFTFRSDQPHRFRNTGAEGASLFRVGTTLPD